MTGPRVLIIGGGIGGLTAAVALRQTGIPVTVFERTSEPRGVGAGLALSGHAIRALAAMGLAGRVLDEGMPFDRIEIRSRRGRVLMTLPVDRPAGSPNVCIHRPRLQHVLLEALGRDALRLGAAATGVDQDAHGVTARFAGGHTARGDALLAADGVRSAIRTQLFGEARSRYAGYTSWLGTVRYEGSKPGTIFETWGRGSRFCSAYIAPGLLYWYATMNAARACPIGRANPKQTVLHHFRGWHEPIEPIVEATDEAAIMRYDIRHMLPLPRWSRGRVTLLGDAAHSMTPDLGQGACMAIEDAVELAASLRAEPDVPAALRRYEAARKRRTTAIMALSGVRGWVGQWQNAVACSLRDAALAMFPVPVAGTLSQWVLGQDG